VRDSASASCQDDAPTPAVSMVMVSSSYTSSFPCDAGHALPPPPWSPNRGTNCTAAVLESVPVDPVEGDPVPLPLPLPVGLVP